MTKKLSGNTKNKLIIGLIFFITVFIKVLFDIIPAGWTSADRIIVSALSVAAFTAFIILVLNDKAFDLVNAQGVFAVASIAMMLGGLLSVKMVRTGEMMIFLSLAFTSVMILLAQRFETLPVAVIIGAFAAIKLDYVAIVCIPATLGTACIILSEKMKKSPVWQKIVFVLLNTVLIAEAVHSFYIRKYTISTYNFKGDIWDSIASFVFVAVLLTFAFFAIKQKRSIGEIFGYFAVAAFGFVPTFMEMRIVVSSSVAIIMMITAVAKNGSVAETFTDYIIKCIKEKIVK